MSIDPQEFGRLQAQVQQLLDSDKAKTDLLTEMSSALHAMQLQLAEAKGGWHTLVYLGGAAASVGGLLSWALTHFTGKGPA